VEFAVEFLKFGVVVELWIDVRIFWPIFCALTRNCLVI